MRITFPIDATDRRAMASTVNHKPEPELPNTIDAVHTPARTTAKASRLHHVASD
jgi:hypothetical protein